MRRPVTRLVTTALVACCALLPAAAHARPSNASVPGAYYLALGDSLAYGVTAPGIPTDPTCQSATAPSYVCQVYGYLKQITPGLQLENLSAPDVDSCVMVHGYKSGSACANPPGITPLDSPLQSALAFIKAHPGQVNPVTVNVGGADLIPLLPRALTDLNGTVALLPGVFSGFQSNLDEILSSLRAALGPNATIVLATQYNPLGGIGSPPLPAGLPAVAAGAIGHLNQVMTAEAGKYQASVADVAGVFDANPGGAALLTFVPTSLASGDPSKIDIYPLLSGYHLFADTVLKAGGFQQQASVKLHLSAVRTKRKGHVTVTGVVTSGATVTVRVKTAAGKTSTSAPLQADNTGAFAVKVGVGPKAGKTRFHVCAADPVSGSSACRNASVKVT